MLNHFLFEKVCKTSICDALLAFIRVVRVEANILQMAQVGTGVRADKGGGSAVIGFGRFPEKLLGVGDDIS